MSNHEHEKHAQGHAHPHTNDAELAQTLNLDARILGSYLTEATAWAASLSAKEPETMIDVGAGSGVGTVALAQQFPHAAVTALDKSAQMLTMTRAAAAENGVGARVRGIQTDLDEAWPSEITADLLWASSSLHEVADPYRVLTDMFAALNPGGLLLVLEMDGLPSFLPETLPAGSPLAPGLEPRLHEILAGMGWNHFPDWQPVLASVGFTVQRRPFPTVGSSTPELAARYARHFLARIHQTLADTASPTGAYSPTDAASSADMASLELLLGDGPESLERRGDLQVRGHRTGWAARKP